MNSNTIYELSDYIVDTYLRVSPKYVKLDIIKQECVSYLTSLKNKLERLYYEPPIEKIAVIDFIFTGDSLHPEPPYEKYKDLYDEDTYHKHYIPKLLTCNSKEYDGEDYFATEVNHIIYKYFLND